MNKYINTLTGEILETDGNKNVALRYFRDGINPKLKRRFVQPYEIWKKKLDGKTTYQFEWNDLRACITVVNVILVMLFGYSIAWFGLTVSCLGCIKDLTEIPDGKFRFSSLIMHLANVVLNIYFLTLAFVG